MYSTNAFYLASLSRCVWIVPALRRRPRAFRNTLDTGLLIFFSVLCLAISGCSYFAYSRHAEELERANLNCLALNVYYEARGEPKTGQVAVAEVTMNRVASKYYPNSVCAVVYQKNWDPIRGRYVGAFSWSEFDKLSPPKGRAWQQAQEIATAVFYRRFPQAPELRNALHYHSIYIRPNWADERRVVELIGNHFFYN